MRRINPRGQPVTGQGETPAAATILIRVIRRGLPYGPAYDSDANPTTVSSAGLSRLFHQLKHRETNMSSFWGIG